VVVVVEEEEDCNALIVLPCGTCLLGVSVSFPVQTTTSLSIITSLGPADDGNVADKEGGGGRWWSHVMRGQNDRHF
jgi:hypothetical protein